MQFTAESGLLAQWTVQWTYTDGQTVIQSWGTTLTSSGADVTARNVSYNGTLPAGGMATFGFLATAGATNRVPTLTCAPT